MDVFAQICLKLGHIEIFFLIIILGILNHQREPYIMAVKFLMVVMIFNALLKNIFAVPLFSHLGPGYAFPSGHMHAATVFYGYFFYKTQNLYLKILLLGIIGGEGFGLVRCHFHEGIDVIGSAVFGAIELFIYHLLTLKFRETVIAIFMTAFAFVCLIILATKYTLYPHVVLAFYTLIGLEIAQGIFPEARLCRRLQRGCALGLTIALLWTNFQAFRFLKFHSIYLSQLKYFLIPFTLLGSMTWVASIKSLKQKN